MKPYVKAIITSLLAILCVARNGGDQFPPGTNVWIGPPDYWIDTNVTNHFTKTNEFKILSVQYPPPKTNWTLTWEGDGYPEVEANFYFLTNTVTVSHLVMVVVAEGKTNHIHIRELGRK